MAIEKFKDCCYKLGAITGVVGLVVGAIGGAAFDGNDYSLENLRTAVKESEKLAEVAQAKAVSEAVKDLHTDEDVLAAVNDATVKAVDKALKDAEDAREEAEVIEAERVFWDEDYNLGDTVSFTLNDNDVKVLIDDEIDFDGDDYDVREEVEVLGELTAVTNDDDYDGVAQFQLLEDTGIIYRYKFVDSVPADDIDEDEELTITFAGRELDIIKATDTELTIRTGERHFMEEGETKNITIDGKDVNVEIRIIEDEGDQEVTFVVDGEAETIEEGESNDIGDYEVSVRKVLANEYGEGRGDMVEFFIGKEDETQQDIRKGDPMELFGEPDDKSDAEWVWDFDVSGGELKEISAVYNQDRDDLDDNDGWTPLQVRDSISLPNDYLKVVFKNIDEFDTVDLDFDYDVGDSVVEIDADEEDAFEVGGEEYDSIYTDGDTFYDDEDNDIGDTVELSDSDYILEVDGDVISVANVEAEWDFGTGELTSLEADGEDISLFDGDYLTDLFVEVLNAENNYEDGELRIALPDEEDIEVTIAVEE